ncbi:MAG: hypothetical protein LBU04_00720, partial [Christensenellaceae bacterium]|nr:hypothetical protein [Christensenellaceae bacterium]
KHYLFWIGVLYWCDIFCYFMVYLFWNVDNFFSSISSSSTQDGNLSKFAVLQDIRSSFFQLPKKKA